VARVEAEVGSAASSYEILAKLATGGMAEIFLARGASTGGLERYVVLKRILRHRAHDQAFVRMFLDEARLAAQLQHPNIAQVYDIGKLGDSYFFTMEYVHGETVRALLQRSHALRAPIPIGSVLVIAAGAASGLHHAHERNGLDGKPLGIVHRDVSPSNLMASYEGGVKVVDFGVAKAAHRSQETRSGTVKGKISYLSPEQCRGGSVDRRSDLFSLGIVLWEMLTTERLYKRATDFEAMAAIVSEPVPPPSSRRPDVPRELDALVLQLLSKDPAERFQSADHVHEAIESVAVRVGSALSSAGLARYLRELFGQRPEPWIEMQSRDAHPEVFTVTSEPIPADLTSRPLDALESQLGAVPDLSDDAASESDASEQPVPMYEGPGVRPPDLLTTTPFRRDDVPPIARMPPATQPGTGASPFVQPQHAATGPQRRPDHTTGPQPMRVPITGPQQPGRTPTVDMRASAPAYAQRDSSGPNVAPAGSFSGPYPLYQKPPPPQPDAKQGVPRVLFIVLGAVTIGIVVGIILAVSGGGKPVASVHDAATVVMMSIADAATVAVVAPPVEVPIDAAPPPSDAAIEKAAPEPSPAETLAHQLDQGHNSDAVATCIASSALVGAAPASCALAACHARDAAHAKKWYASAGSKRSSIVGACKAVGITLETAAPAPPPPREKEPPPHEPKQDCVGDPMACQH
jgi:serine/threonine protein kinase